ncbi:MAG TPA: bifunctional 3-(3-hydroxy-phenyl)propionate/3-hydroxycinnamic acid hydroxylase [Thermomonospora sp.]|nr:bifunctional 3-(3-hydroxy-phenyl)propionate/3-hydroxycinnamic acid hydroxylase [Thermomonospora sp.]
MGADVRTEVLIVGYGPVGQLLAVLLAQRGRDVTVVERWPQPYTMPRAVAFDGESARILASAGLGPYIGEFGEPSGDYAWLNGEGVELLHYDAPPDRTRSGWPDSTSMYQPGLEAALIERGRSLPSLRVHRGYEATAFTEDDDGVEVVAESREGAGRLTVRARWVVGCDGANSFVARTVGTDYTDLGFRHDWLICDVVPHEKREYQPNNLQICDPARPRTEVSAGPGHRRWEFMRVAGETVADLDSREAAWRLLGLFGVTPESGTLERHAVYTFEARYARRWRSGRALLAGDAAHLMPPFAAQGMSSGFRDVANLAWKLDLVLTGRACERILDSYTPERRGHVQHAISMSVNLGRVICQTDPDAARDRDEILLAARARAQASGGEQPSAVAPLTEGLLYGPGGGGAGDLTPQGRVGRDGTVDLFDEIVGRGFVVITTEPTDTLLDDDRLRYLESLGTRLVRVVPPGVPSGPSTVTDEDGVYRRYLAEHSATAALVRPDFYLFGTARDAEGLAALVDDLRGQLSPVPVEAQS